MLGDKTCFPPPVRLSRCGPRAVGLCASVRRCVINTRCPCGACSGGLGFNHSQEAREQASAAPNLLCG